ncbi:MAG: hypothetical protein ACREQ5_07230, partial [Candidatus Dormibacteria bacterium]
MADTTDVKAKMAELPEVFKQGLGESEQAVSDAGTRMEARMEKAGEGAGNKFVDAFNLATAAIATTFLFKLREAVEQSAQMATQIKILSDVSGMSTTGVQKLQYAFSSVGISAEASRASLQQFQRVAANMVDVAQRTGFKGTTMLERMGIDPKQFENLNLEDQIKKVADRYKSLPAAQRAQTAEMFFGRGGLEMDPILAKGQTGVSQAVAGAGPTVPEAAIEKLHALEGGLATTGLEVKTLSAEFATTMAPAIMSVLGIIDRIVTGFSKMSYAIKQNFVVVALIAAFTQFDKALEFVSNFLRSIQFAEMAGALEVLGGPLIEIARLAGLLYIAFKSNFGNIRPVVEDVGRAVGDFAKNAQSFFTKISKVVTADLEPGISALSKAFAPLFAAIGAQLSAFLESSDTWNELGVAINIVATAVGLVAQGIAAIISPFSNFVGALTTDQREFLATGAAIAGIGIAFEVLAKSPFFMAQAIAIGEAAIAKVVTTVEALGAAWRFVASGEALAWVGMNLLTFGVPLAIAAVVAAVLLLWKNWDAVGRLVEKISAAWLEHLGALVSAIGDVETAIADFLNTLPGLQGMAKVIQGMADSARMLAGYLDAAAAAQKKLGDAVPPTYTEDTTEDRSHAAASRAAAGERPTKPGEPPTVIHPLNPATKTTHPSTKAATAAINAVKDSFRDLDSAVKTSTERIAELRADLALIGVINTPAKLSAAQAIMNKEVLESIRLTKNYHDLAAKETEGSAHLARLGAHEKNPAAQRLFVNAARSESDAAIKDRTKEKEQMVKTRDEQLKLKDATAAYYAVIAA